MVKELTDATFKTEVLDVKDTPVLVDFWAPWCGPCRMLAPVVEQMEKQFTGKMAFAKINTDEYQQNASNYNISGIPCLIIFKDGREAARLVGFRPADAMAVELNKLVN